MERRNGKAEMKCTEEWSPRVSIVIPVYNGSNFLREAIDSALAQTYGNIEVIVINDGSTDDGLTEEIAVSYGDKLRYFRKENGGVASALNLGIREMTGEYFSWLSHDDVYCPDKVADQVEWLRQHGLKPEVILYSDYDLIDSVSRVTGQTQVRHLDPQEFLSYLVMEHPVNGCTTLVPKMCFEKVGMFDERLKTTQDYDLWLRMAWHYAFVHIPRPLIQSRIHPDQGSITMSSVQHQEQHEFFMGYLTKISSRRDYPDALCCLLKNAIHLVKNKFPEAGAYGYTAARIKMAEGNVSLRSLCLMGYYHMVGFAARLYRRVRMSSSLPSGNLSGMK